MDWKKVGTIAYMVLMVFYGIYTMVLSIQAYSKFNDSSQAYLNMAENLKQPYLIDLALQPGGCQSDYTSLASWNWQGTDEGCDCTASTYTSAAQKAVIAKQCNSTETQKGCKVMNAVSAVNFTAIEGSSSISPMYICYKRADSSKAFYNIAAQQSGKCSSSQKTCGNPTIPGTVICVEAAEPCPIYGYAISAGGDITTYPTPEWTETPLPNSLSLYVNQLGTTAKTLPYSELRFTEAGGVCTYNNNASKVIDNCFDFERLPSGSKDYLLIKSTRSSCSDIDQTFNQGSIVIAENLYHSLNIPSSDWNKMLTWPGYATPTSTEKFQSYTRPFINWKVSERALMHDFVDSAATIKNLKTAQLVAMVVGILVCILVSIILSISQVYNLCGKDVPCISGKGEEELKKIICIKSGISYGAKLLQLPFLLWAFISSSKKKNILNSVADMQISDSIFNNQIKDFATEIEDNVFKKNMIALIILCITIFIDLLLLIKAKCCSSGDKKDEGKKEKKNDEENQKKYELANNHSQVMNNHSDSNNPNGHNDKKKDKKGKKDKHKKKGSGSSDSSSSDSDNDSGHKKKDKKGQKKNKQEVHGPEVIGGLGGPSHPPPPMFDGLFPHNGQPVQFGGMIPMNGGMYPPAAPPGIPAQPQLVNPHGIQFNGNPQGPVNPHQPANPYPVNPHGPANPGGFNNTLLGTVGFQPDMHGGIQHQEGPTLGGGGFQPNLNGGIQHREGPTLGSVGIQPESQGGIQYQSSIGVSGNRSHGEQNAMQMRSISGQNPPHHNSQMGISLGNNFGGIAPDGGYSSQQQNRQIA